MLCVMFQVLSILRPIDALNYRRDLRFLACGQVFCSTHINLASKKRAYNSLNSDF